MTTTLTVANRIATISTDEKIVAGNTYAVTLSLDSEWTGTYYVRVRFGSLYYDIPASGSSVNVQIPVGYPEVGLGIYSENIGICTNEVRVKVLRSILEQGVSVVEFDTDLYNQWANEVSELVCDSDFDAESDRPVKNSVITAWKNSVPLDSAVVHKNGNETVNGVKTLTNNPIITNITPAIYFQSSAVSTESAWRGLYRVTDKKNGANDTFFEVRLVGGDGTTRNALEVNLTKPDRSAMVGIAVQNYGDHTQIIMPTYYPVDSGGNPVPLAGNLVMASGNIAVDPRIVHTTGNETLAGNKTFTGYTSFRGSTPSVKLVTSTQGTGGGIYADLTIRDQYGGSDSDLSIFSWGKSSSNYNFSRMLVKSPDKATDFSLEQRVYNDHHVLVGTPYYPVDSGGNPQALPASDFVTSGNIAVDPRIVHTTGNEIVAGEKTFSNGFNGYPVGWHKVSGGTSVGQYNVFARISANDLGRLIYFEVAQSSNRVPAHGCFIVRAYRTSPVPIWSWRSAHNYSDSPIKDGSLYVLVKDDVIYLAWKRQFQYGGLMVRVYLDTLNGNVQSTASSVVEFSGDGIGIVDNLDGYTVYEVAQ